MKKDLDLLVLGTGTAGQTVATACREHGWNVAMVEHADPGGTCAHHGCDAKKPLVNAAQLLAEIKRYRGKGVGASDVEINWAELMSFKKSFTDPIPGRTEEKLAELDIELIKGEPRFVSTNTVEVDGRELYARYIHIATGNKPRTLNIPGEELLSQSRDFLELEQLPQNIAFIGGGYVSFELATVAAAAGAKVTILEESELPLRQFDDELVEELLVSVRNFGVDVRLRSCVETIEREGDRLKLSCEGNSLTADLVIHGAGRVPSIDKLDLEKADVAYDEHGIRTNPYMQSETNPAVYAAGDVAWGGKPLTPVSSVEAKAVVHNLFNGNSVKPVHDTVPTAVFTIPPLAAVGETEQSAQEQGLNPVVHKHDLTGEKEFRQMGADNALCKVVLDENEEQILGAHYLGPHAEEVINIFSLAMHQGLTAKQVKDNIFTYPTIANLLKGVI